MAHEPVHDVDPGDFTMLGATPTEGGVNFALFSAHAERVELCLFDADGRKETRILLPEYTHEIWHGHIPGLKPGVLYGYRVHGPYEPENGHRFNPNKLLLDPYAREIVGEVNWGQTTFAYDLESEEKDLSFNDTDSAPDMPKCRVVDAADFSEKDTRPGTPWSRTIFYEAHVNGMTRLHPAIPEELRGTFEGLAEREIVQYVKSLGVSSIELLPVHYFPDDPHLLDKGLRNYWGYNTIGFFAPASRYYGPRGLAGFRDMVRSFHDAGIEVILDVVYNHTAEGNELGPTLSFKGIDNFSYYRTMPGEPRYYINDTGTGNTVNTSHPRVLQMITDSLRYWAEVMNVDGFRFDLGTILGREPEGFDQRGGFFDAVGQDPVLSRLKLIGEPWDIGPGGYQVGGFPPGWSEWNDKYRDTMRDYWKDEDGMARDFAARILGSGDIYDFRGRRPWASVNFVTAHDGFTLNDLVSYNDKHNEANGEDNQDGHDHNRSFNYGAEGPTDDAGINMVRERQKRNFLATLLFSHGVPMLLAGDEFGRSQMGNNNGYCQDSEVSWFHWQGLPDSATELREFTGRLIALRQSQPLLRRESWRNGIAITWLNPTGGEQTDEHWDDEGSTTLGLRLSCDELVDEEGWNDVLFLFNPHDGQVIFHLPPVGTGWVLELTTSNPAVEAADLSQAEDYPLEPRSLALLRPK
ncbi:MULTISPECIES: glycogen debranching protein GlgX [Rhizobium]|uniref:Glycogen operon protein GlgX homolog n=1 Tax=Rhizobium favelukesii TaxID=348824 RepID=W6RQE0_9HYPH|nr:MULTISPECIES: glycogen debranching protein GlgX [Rhizobium]MCS0457877.1 glycogen debranching protein GlgX [Rhizobium favelukesii]UFS80519.1 glycogen debranching protein GlgX [Rhizobium sp. T136]CDM62390.1 Glycogen operon protein GlgX homolog [Rhizobium favelukesii]